MAVRARGKSGIEVLLATYNGARFLREQIDSIGAQDYPEVSILARDDGSSDATAAILAEYAEAYPQNFRVMPSDVATGSARMNFARLMQRASAAYIAFADQDDVWEATKLTRQMEAMRTLEARHARGTPLLIFSDLRVVDEQLTVLQDSLWKHLGLNAASVHEPAKLLGRSVVTGCTMLINRPMLLLARQMPGEAVMHDRWMGLLAAFLGAADFVNEPTVRYRQHAANVVGATAADGSLRGVAARISSSVGRRTERYRSEEQAEALLGLYREELRPERKLLLKRYLRSGRSSDPFTRIWLTLRCGFYRGSTAANLALLKDLALAPSEHRR